MRHPWPGNVRELLNTLRRIAVWSDGLVVHADDARDALLPATSSPVKGILDRPLGHGLALPELLSEVARHYLARAMREANGNKTKAAELIGLPSYQTLTNWLSRHQIDVGNEPA
jgi:DNA-binding NtrC family response regulator